MAGELNAGWYDDGSGTQRWWDGQKCTDSVQQSPSQQGGGGFAGMVSKIQADAAGMVSKIQADAAGRVSKIQADAAAAAQPRPAAQGMNYVVLQVILKEKFLGTGSGNLTELEGVINSQAALGYRLHTISTSSSGSKGFAGGDRIQATMVFERIG